ncbi:hypothetical protein Q4519_14780 [Motilimonas sp. 1_MG-2023]|uniref:hypothetical protein n=1 Tax=Motilimonas sp. 1_MG-2023 TaxID=3062672 RepID=UPI0026E152AA|nr:hypothetical protein [Motilimonas sp. 1_MG-2023]MDO6526949.1 hypothetical protein [Motilimonas sp. 1_MG-2023]
MSTCTINLNVSDLVAIISLLVAALSAIYARRATIEASRANEISLLTHRESIYDAFLDLKMHLQHKGYKAELSEVTKFYCSLKSVKRYFPDEEKLKIQISEYYNACFKIAQVYEKAGGFNSDSLTEIAPFLETEKKLAPELESSLLSIINKATSRH